LRFEAEDRAVWDAAREEARERRAANRERSTALLRAHDVGFQARNGGAHLIVRGRFDFWPGTGLWRDRESREMGRGVFALLRALGVAVPPTGPRFPSRVASPVCAEKQEG
jgi:hypothetical protein